MASMSDNSVGFTIHIINNVVTYYKNIGIQNRTSIWDQCYMDYNMYVNMKPNSYGGRFLFSSSEKKTEFLLRLG
jgi:hypothetical protein